MTESKSRKFKLYSVLFPTTLLLFAISAFLPYIHSSYTIITGAMVYVFGGFIGFSFVIASYILAYKSRRKLSIVFQILGIISIGIPGFLFAPFGLPGLGFYFNLVAWIGFCVILHCLIKDEDLKKKDVERKIKKKQDETKIMKKQVIRLIGMIKAERQINMEFASNILDMPEKDIRLMIYELVGEGKLEGRFQGKDFMITSEIDPLIISLGDAFSIWDSKSITKED